MAEASFLVGHILKEHFFIIIIICVAVCSGLSFIVQTT